HRPAHTQPAGPSTAGPAHPGDGGGTGFAIAGSEHLPVQPPDPSAGNRHRPQPHHPGLAAAVANPGRGAVLPPSRQCAAACAALPPVDRLYLVILLCRSFRWCGRSVALWGDLAMAGRRRSVVGRWGILLALVYCAPGAVGCSTVPGASGIPFLSPPRHSLL